MLTVDVSPGCQLSLIFPVDGFVVSIEMGAPKVPTTIAFQALLFNANK